MEIFKNLVPFVTFWFPNGVEKSFTCDEGEIVSNQYGLSAKIIKNGKTVYCAVKHDSGINEGDKFTSFKVISLRKYGYAYSKKHNLIKMPVRYRYGDNEAFVVWRVSEIH
jgi:hypothetical protein